MTPEPPEAAATAMVWVGPVQRSALGPAQGAAVRQEGALSTASKHLGPDIQSTDSGLQHRSRAVIKDAFDGRQQFFPRKNRHANGGRRYWTLMLATNARQSITAQAAFGANTALQRMLFLSVQHV
mmetsp:Transcript_1733/g.3289  ORF Transcript_1733/g.3289 Transcript_1733/m.3289 type:complete len:125 (+) Transcript_1733:1112-1486(+)